MQRLKEWEYIVQALAVLGGEAHLSDIYDEVFRLRRQDGMPIKANQKEFIRRSLQENSSDTQTFLSKQATGASVLDLFYNKRVGKGIWGLKAYNPLFKKASDPSSGVFTKKSISPTYPSMPAPPMRIPTHSFRFKRNTGMVDALKSLYQDRCQICGTVIQTHAGDVTYSEAHHIHPLNARGYDMRDNILIVCPNHHVMLDRAYIPLNKRDLILLHEIDDRHLEFHNRRLGS